MFAMGYGHVSALPGQIARAQGMGPREAGTGFRNILRDIARQLDAFPSL